MLWWSFDVFCLCPILGTSLQAACFVLQKSATRLFGAGFNDEGVWCSDPPICQGLDPPPPGGAIGTQIQVFAFGASHLNLLHFYRFFFADFHPFWASW